MNNLPKEFPKYCNDLKQELDRIQEVIKNDGFYNEIKLHSDYPKKENEHKTLDDARWKK